MQMDIMNELLTSTVMSLFGGKVSPLFEKKSKPKVEGTVRRESVTEESWMSKEAYVKLKQSMKVLGIQDDPSQKSLDGMNFHQLSEEKKKVKNELKKYDNQFLMLFGRNPEKKEKEPLRPLYLYYKRIKNCLEQRFGSREVAEIQRQIQRLEDERSQLRTLIEKYQRGFEDTNHRKIMYLKDIQPIESQYARYKEIKNLIKELNERVMRIAST